MNIIINFQVIANVVCWSVIMMLKEYFSIALAFSALAVFAALMLNKKCCTCTNGNQKDPESNQEEENNTEGQPLIEPGGQEKIELEVKLESATEEGSNTVGRKELAEVSKDNEGVSKHKGTRKGQAGGKGPKVGKESIEGQKENEDSRD